MVQPTETRRGPEPPDISERGGMKNGQPQRSDTRLFMQLQAFGGCIEIGPLVDALQASNLRGVLYEDVNDARGVALLVCSSDPGVFVGTLRQLLNAPPFLELTQKPEFTMMGRTYASGYEPDLDETLVARPTRTVLNGAWPWAIWYPLRRSGRFAQLPAEERQTVVDGWKPLAGQSALVPLQSASASQTPAEPRHTIVEASKESLGQTEEVPVQASSISQLPADERHVVADDS